MYSLAPDTFHEIELKPNLFDENGDLVIVFHNPNPTALLFPLNEGLEILYREGSFGLNFMRGLGVILCWMALLAALGMAAASFLSFPVAAFVSLSLLLVVFSSGTISTAVTEGTVIGFDTDESYIPGRKQVDFVLVKAFKVTLEVINLVRQFSPVEALSMGRSVTWSQLGLAIAVVVLLFGGFLASFGIFAFHRRELATAQGTS